MSTTTMTDNRYRKRPDIDSRIATSRYGVVTVLATSRDGRVLEVLDRLGRDWTVERDPAGWWHLADPADTPTGSTTRKDTS